MVVLNLLQFKVCFFLFDKKTCLDFILKFQFLISVKNLENTISKWFQETSTPEKSFWTWRRNRTGRTEWGGFSSGSSSSSASCSGSGAFQESWETRGNEQRLKYLNNPVVFSWFFGWMFRISWPLTKKVFSASVVRNPRCSS